MGDKEKLNVETLETGAGEPVAKMNDADNASTGAAGQASSEDKNISILEHSNMDEPESTDAWKGDERYFQTGPRAGSLRPKFSRELGGVDSESAAKTGDASVGAPKLNIADLKSSSSKFAERAEKTKGEEIKELKAKKKQLSAEFSSKVVMRLLDAVVGIISKGTYGAGMSDKQIKERLTYRDMLQAEWREYLLTLDVDLAPWAMVAVGSLDYVGAAFNSTGGKERAQSVTEKIGGKMLGWLFRSKTK